MEIAIRGMIGQVDVIDTEEDHKTRHGEKEVMWTGGWVGAVLIISYELDVCLRGGTE